MRAVRDPYWVVVLVLVAAIALVTDSGSVAVDTKPQLYLNPHAALRSAVSAWQTVPALGQRSYEVGMLLPALMTDTWHAVGVPGWLIMRVVRIALVMLGVAGAVQVGREALGDRKGASRLAPRVGGLVYLLHPYVLVSGATLPVMWPWALLPWAAWAVMRGVRSGRTVWWGLAAGLLVGAMGGQNAGSVVLIQLAVTLPVVAFVTAFNCGHRLQPAVVVLSVTGLVSLLLSAYWLLPSLAARSAGAAVVAQSESGDSISAVSSWSEVIRGLGLWTLYGRSATGPWVPAHVPLLTAPLVVAAGFGLVAAVWGALAVAPRALLRLPLTLVVVAAAVMVGAHPWSDPSPLGRAWVRVLEVVPALAVFRTTNKAGAALVLGVALLAVVLVATARHRRAVAVTVVVVALVAVTPAWSAGLFVSHADVPGYWQRAVTTTDRHGARLWFLPGQTSAAYTWTDPRPDDVVQGLYGAREVFVRTTVANSSPGGASLLAGLDRRLHEGTLPPAALASVARYLGVSDVAVRNDLDLAAVGGAAPGLVAAEVTGSAGTTPGPTFGEASPDTAGRRPVEVFHVDAAMTGPSVVPRAAVTVLVGDGSAVPDLAQLGYLDGRVPFVYASDIASDNAAALLSGSNRVVLTDTNRRRELVGNRLTEDYGPVVSSDTDVVTTALGSPQDQTVRVGRGWGATASREGSIFRTVAWAAAENAVDGDASTSWFAGDYGSAVGQHLHITFPTPTGGRLEVRTDGLGGAAITGLDLRTARGTSALVPVGDGDFRGEVPAGSAAVDVVVRAIDPASQGNVGISEVLVDGRGAPAADSLRLPVTLSEAVARAQAAGTPLAPRPVDVVLNRQLGSTTAPRADEPTIIRDVDLPWAQRLTIRGVVRLGSPMPESVIDDMEGADGSVRASSTSQAFGLPTVRASMALDGDRGTGWMPAEPVLGARWTMEADRPSRTDRIRLRQPTSGRQMLSVAVRVNDDVVVRSRLRPGVTTVALPRVMDVSGLEITVLGVSTPATAPPKLLEVEVGEARIDRPHVDDPGCATMGQLDGRAVRMRPTSPVTGVSVLATDCDPGRDLSAGAHRWEGVAGWTPDSVVWGADDRPPTRPVTPIALRTEQVDLPGQGSDPSWSGRITPSDADSVLVSGAGYDPAWTASVSGTDLGAPVLVDGWSAGWLVPKGVGGVVTIEFGPQRSVWLGLLVSLLVATVSCAALWVWRRPGRLELAGRELRVPGPRPAQAQSDADTPGPGQAVDKGRLRSRTTLMGVGRIVGWVVLGLVVGGAWGVLGAALGLLLRRAPARVAAALLVAGWSCVAVAWFVGVGPLLGNVTPELVAQTGAASSLSLMVCLASLVWVWARQGGENDVPATPPVGTAA
jgi:arabinofuranan 3-O-arabinosyltransferase